MYLTTFATAGLVTALSTLIPTNHPVAVTNPGAITSPAPVTRTTTDLLANPLFELDGNALKSSCASMPDDWQCLYNGTGHADVFSGILCDRAGQGCNPEVADTIFVGGKKDIQDISEWGSKTASGLPDKDDLTNAYAAAYTEPIGGDQIFYFGADRYANVGDADLGFWFLKKRIVARNGRFVEQLGDGTFVQGHHEIGDILVLVNFPQGANAHPCFNVVEWNPPLADVATNLHQLGGCTDCTANPPCVSPECDGTDVPPDAVCATTNHQLSANDPTPSPWPYRPKSGTTGLFPYESFYEGGIDLEALGFPPGVNCFSTFMAETRSSEQFSATLKDFVLGSFDTCHIACDSATCEFTSHNADFTDQVVHVTACVQNDGQGTFPAGSTLTVNVHPGNPVLATFSAVLQQPLVPNGVACVQGDFHTPLSSVNYTFEATIVSPQGASASTSSVPACSGSCVLVVPEMEVTKECDGVTYVQENGRLVVRVDFSGTVKNIGNIVLDTVTLTDVPTATITPSVFNNLAPGVTVNFTGFYFPSATDSGTNDPCLAEFTDTITAVATCQSGDCPLTRYAAATCRHCPP
jgi:hypothetical protein